MQSAHEGEKIRLPDTFFVKNDYPSIIFAKNCVLYTIGYNSCLKHKDNIGIFKRIII